MLLPVRDGAETLGRALASIVGQTFDDFEIVAVDDGSTDRSPEILAETAAAEPRLRLFVRPHGGIVSALETARAAARGPLLARMDADDVARPERLALQVAALADRPDWGVCGGHVRIVPRAGLTDGRRRYERWLNGLASVDDVERDLFVECPLAHPTWLLRADAVAAVGGYREAGWAEDHDLLFRLRAAGWHLGTVPEVVLEWTDRPDRLSRTDPTYALEAFMRARAHHLPLLHPRARAGVVVCGAGPVGRSFSRAARGSGLPVRGFVDTDPRKIGRTVHGAPVVSPDAVEPWLDAFFVAAVGRAGAREGIRRWLAEVGLVDGRDFVAVA